MKLPRMIRNLWIYRRLIALAVLLGVALSFVVSNGETVKVTFPLIGSIESRSGIVMLVSAALGAAVSWLVMTVRHALREALGRPEPPGLDQATTPGKAEPAGEAGEQESEGPQEAGP